MSKFVEEISNEFETDLIVFEKLIKNNQEEDSFIMRDCIMRNIIGMLETIESIDDNAFDKLKNIQKSNPPKQKVVQVKESKRDNEKSYMLWLNKELLKDLKKRAIEEDSNMKEIIEKALNQYLRK